MNNPFSFFLAMFLSPFLSLGQSQTPKIIGNWHANKYENLATGEVLYASENANRDIQLSFSQNGNLRSDACNGVRCNYTLEKDTLVISCGFSTYKHCLGWEGIIEYAFKSYGNRLKIIFKEGDLQLEVDNHFRLTLIR
jgi:heat shock protein HslJ